MHTACLRQGIRSSAFESSYRARCSAVIGGVFFTAVIGASRSSMLLSCSLGGALSCRLFFFFFFFIVGHPRLKNFYSTVPVGVVRVTSYVNCLFDPVSVPVRITINKLNLILKRLCCGRALKRRRSEHGLFRCIGRTPSFCLALVFQSR